MSSISFIPELKEFLKGNKFIHTVRKYKMTDALVEVSGIGECHRIPLGEVYKKENLIPYVESSGFSTIDGWWNKIKFFIPSNKDSMYLYKVEVIK